MTSFLFTPSQEFPTYLLPSTPTAPTRTILTCLTCRTHLTPLTSVISKTFRGRHGRAYLLSSDSLQPHQIVLSPPQQRQLVTGVHTVRDFSCRVCGEALGWRYEHAREEGQRYKIGKWVLERERVGRLGGEGRRGVLEKEVEELLNTKDVDLDDVEVREMMFRGY